MESSALEGLPAERIQTPALGREDLEDRARDFVVRMAAFLNPDD